MNWDTHESNQFYWTKRPKPFYFIPKYQWKACPDKSEKTCVFIHSVTCVSYYKKFIIHQGYGLCGAYVDPGVVMFRSIEHLRGERRSLEYSALGELDSSCKEVRCRSSHRSQKRRERPLSGWEGALEKRIPGPREDNSRT